MAKKKNLIIKCMSPRCRIAFSKVFEAEAFKDGDKAKFSVAMLFDPAAQKTKEYLAMRKAIGQCMAQVHGPDPKKWSPDATNPWKNPIRDAGLKADKWEGYEVGHTFIGANSKNKPQVINMAGKILTTEDEFYSGCYAKVSLAATYFEHMGNYGVKFFLNNICFLEDGENLSGIASAHADFGVEKTTLENMVDSNSDLDGIAEVGSELTGNF